MTATLLAVLLAVSAPYTAGARAPAGPGCGPPSVKFDVKTEKKPKTAPVSRSGKAIVFFLQDDLKFGSRPRPTTRFGIDGTWVGATHANSYFFALVDPGEHHVCANWQSRVILFSPTRSTAATHFKAVAGKVYYFRARDIAIFDHPGGALLYEPEVRLSALDADEARVLMGSFSYSLSHPKK
jgi:hypothetical protein